MSFKPRIKTFNEAGFHTNNTAFETYDEAYAAGRDILNRWMLAQEHDVVESDQPANYRWAEGLVPINPENKNVA